MRLYVEQMDATVVEVSEDGQVRLQDEAWSTPSFQERRAIIYAAENERDQLIELLEILNPPEKLSGPR